MAIRPRALIILPESPFPAIGGGALRSASLVEYLAGKYDLDAVTFRVEDGSHTVANRLNDLCRRVHTIALPNHRQNAVSRAARNLGRLWRRMPPLFDRFSGFQDALVSFIGSESYKISLVEHFWCASYGEVLKTRSHRTVLDLHNIESILHQRCADSEQWPLSQVHESFGRTCRQLEEQYLPGFSMLMTTSETDAAQIRRIAPGTSAGVYPNTIPFLRQPSVEVRDEIAFSANLEYHPNISAVRWFSRRVWPELRRRWPGFTWKLIGKNPSAVARYVKNDPTIQLTGPLEDAVAELAGAKVAIVPLLAGSGTRIKILEAWAAATPVVSTSIGMEGLPATPGEHLLVADSPADFVDAISSLLSSDSLRTRISHAGRGLYEERFTWQAGWKLLNGIGI